MPKTELNGSLISDSSELYRNHLESRLGTALARLPFTQTEITEFANKLHTSTWTEKDLSNLLRLADMSVTFEEIVRAQQLTRTYLPGEIIAQMQIGKRTLEYIISICMKSFVTPSEVHESLRDRNKWEQFISKHIQVSTDLLPEFVESRHILLNWSNTFLNVT